MKQASAAPPAPPPPWWQAFVVGGGAGCLATTIVQPADVVKVRQQGLGQGSRVRIPNALSVARSLVASEGVRGLYAGISAAYARQLVYGSARLGLFRTFSDALRARRPPGRPLPLHEKALAGLGAGALGSILGNPTEVALVRMQADGALPAASRRGYAGIGDALRRIVREEGVAALWAGSAPTVLRAVALNVAMLASADELRERLGPLLGGADSAAAVGASSLASGVAASVASLPFDLVKTRLQQQQPDAATGRLPYAGVLDCASKTVRGEGVGALWKGLPTYVVRIAPHAVITLTAIDVLNRLLRRVTPPSSSS